MFLDAFVSDTYLQHFMFFSAFVSLLFGGLPCVGLTRVHRVSAKGLGFEVKWFQWWVPYGRG